MLILFQAVDIRCQRIILFLTVPSLKEFTHDLFIYRNVHFIMLNLIVKLGYN